MRLFLPEEKIQQIINDCRRAGKGNHNSPSTGICDWKNVSRMVDSPASSSILSPSTTTTDTNPEEDILIQNPGDIESGFSGQDALVDPPPAEMEWKRNHSLLSRPDCTIRCLPPRMGSSLQWGKNKTPLVSPRKDSAHQLLGAPGRILCSQSLHQAKEQSPGTTADGQPLSSLLCEQDRRYTLTNPFLPSLSAVAMVSPHTEIILSAEHLPGIMNTIVDQESCQVESLAEWRLHREVFDMIQQTLGICRVQSG